MRPFRHAYQWRSIWVKMFKSILCMLDAQNGIHPNVNAILMWLFYMCSSSYFNYYRIWIQIIPRDNCRMINVSAVWANLIWSHFTQEAEHLIQSYVFNVMCFFEIILEYDGLDGYLLSYLSIFNKHRYCNR